MELSKKSLEQTTKLLRDFEDNYKKGLRDSIKVATEVLYQKVITNCYQNRLGEYIDGIHWEYDEVRNVGRVWSNDLIIILNEFGTGIKGTQDEYASKHGYTVNLSGKGEEGWAFPTKNGEYKWTHGIPSRRMFYDAYEDIKAEIGNIVDIEIRGNIGNLYERTD